MNQLALEASNVLAFEQAKSSGHRVLIVEDEMLIALGLTDMVDALGASWVAASRVGTALALVASDTFDAAIVDLNLAGEPADALMDALSARDIPFIITTGYGPEVIAERYRSLPRFTKPYMSAHVETALLSVLTPGKAGAGSV